MRDFINRKLAVLEEEEKKLQETRDLIEEFNKIASLNEQALEVMQKAAKMSQDSLAEHLSTITTKAIQAVLQEDYIFVCEFVERRGATEADLYVTLDGKKMDILYSTGGGLADVCSFSLKVAYLLLSNVDKTLIIDEVSRHINGKGQRERFAQFIRMVAEDFDIQFIINTAVPEYLDIADKVFHVQKVDKISSIKEITE